MEAEEARSSGFSSFIQRDCNYRNNRPIEFSDNTDSSDEDDIYNSKRPRNSVLEVADNGKVFINPNYRGENPVQGPCSPLKKVRKNNIWGSIIQEQSVSEGLSRRIQVDHDSDIDSDNVESYNYKTKLKDTRPEAEDDLEEVENGEEKPKRNASFTDKETFGNEETNNRKRSHSSRKSAKDRLGRQTGLKERVGERTYDKNKERKHISVTAEDSTAKIVNELVNVLDEPKVELMTRVVETLGAVKALELLYMTEDMEDAGGMMVNNGSRRRTPGGVFLQLLRTDADIEREKVNFIFKDEKDEYRKKQRRKKKRQMKWIDRQVNMTAGEVGPMEEVKEEEVKENKNTEDDEMVTESLLKSSEETETTAKTCSDLEEGEISD